MTAPGFKGLVRENVELRVGATLPINGVMELGAVTESVQVIAAKPLLETETSSTGTVITGDFFQRMPLFQRHSRAVLYLTPGVNAGGLAYAGSLSGFSINGGATGNIGYFEDGMYGVQPSGNNTTDTILSTIDEAKVITTVLPAEYGHSAGGAIVIVKKSGTNTPHGGAGLLFREGPMQHRRFMQPARFEQTGNSLHFYQPDFNVSGPVFIPKLYDGRNKTFFMFAGQYLKERQGEQISWSVPTPEELNGIFAYGGRSGVNAIYDPRTTAVNNGVWTRSPFPGNIIPRAQWDPAASRFLSEKVWETQNLPGSPTATGESGDAYTVGFAGSPFQYMPGVAATRTGRPNSTGERAGLRDNWQDIGSNRFVQAAQNSLVESMNYFSYPAAFTFGNAGRNTFDRQRFIDTQFSASKEWKIKERASATFRFDFQNPFKWCNLPAPNLAVNFTNAAIFGKVSTSTSDEGTTANAGGQGLMNITISFRF